MNQGRSTSENNAGGLQKLFQHKTFFAILFLIFLVAAYTIFRYLTTPCCPTPPVPDEFLDPNTATEVAPGDTRLLLSYDDLLQGFVSSGPVDNRALTQPDDALPPAHSFEGRLELLGESSSGEIRVLRSELESEKALHLPEFDFEFVQSEGYLIPLERGLVITAHPHWNYILEPGRAWQEPGDRGYSRASFPFALVWKGSNAAFNGVMTFLFNDEDVSHVWYQITQETAISLNADLWGLLDARYHPEAIASADEVNVAFAVERAARFPTKPIEQLAVDYPGVDVSAFGSGVSPAHMTWYGLVFDGVNYLGGCQTRYGPYPYCESMRAPSYSTAKSIFVGAALMRLTQLYGDEVPASLIADYVPEAAASPGDWSRVTFDNTLDMATGNYRTSAYMVDEEQWDSDPFWLEQGYAERIAAAFDWPHSAEPGTQWVYRTSDTFILAQALQNFLRSKTDEEADIFDFVVSQVYIPLRMGPGVYSTLRTSDDNWQGEPYGGYGLWWVPDDLAKVAAFMGLHGGRIDGEQILDPSVLAAALQQDPEDRGLRIDSSRRYNNSFWANHYTQEKGFACDFWVPQMLGYSGIVVAFFPNSAVYYYASDNFEFTWDAALRAADKIAPLCK